MKLFHKAENGSERVVSPVMRRTSVREGGSSSSPSSGAVEGEGAWMVCVEVDGLHKRSFALPTFNLSVLSSFTVAEFGLDEGTQWGRIEYENPQERGSRNDLMTSEQFQSCLKLWSSQELRIALPVYMKRATGSVGVVLGSASSPTSSVTSQSSSPSIDRRRSSFTSANSSETVKLERRLTRESTGFFKKISSLSGSKSNSPRGSASLSNSKTNSPRGSPHVSPRSSPRSSGRPRAGTGELLIPIKQEKVSGDPAENPLSPLSQRIKKTFSLSSSKTASPGGSPRSADERVPKSKKPSVERTISPGRTTSPGRAEEQRPKSKKSSVDHALTPGRERGSPGRSTPAEDRPKSRKASMERSDLYRAKYSSPEPAAATLEEEELIAALATLERGQQQDGRIQPKSARGGHTASVMSLFDNVAAPPPSPATTSLLNKGMVTSADALHHAVETLVKTPMPRRASVKLLAEISEQDNDSSVEAADEIAALGVLKALGASRVRQGTTGDVSSPSLSRQSSAGDGSSSSGGGGGGGGGGPAVDPESLSGSGDAELTSPARRRRRRTSRSVIKIGDGVMATSASSSRSSTIRGGPAGRQSSLEEMVQMLRSEPSTPTLLRTSTGGAGGGGVAIRASPSSGAVQRSLGKVIGGADRPKLGKHVSLNALPTARVPVRREPDVSVRLTREISYESHLTNRAMSRRRSLGIEVASWQARRSDSVFSVLEAADSSEDLLALVKRKSREQCMNELRQMGAELQETFPTGSLGPLFAKQKEKLQQRLVQAKEHKYEMKMPTQLKRYDSKLALMDRSPKGSSAAAAAATSSTGSPMDASKRASGARVNEKDLVLTDERRDETVVGPCWSIVSGTLERCIYQILCWMGDSSNETQRVAGLEHGGALAYLLPRLCAKPAVLLETLLTLYTQHAEQQAQRASSVFVVEGVPRFLGLLRVVVERFRKPGNQEWGMLVEAFVDSHLKNQRAQALYHQSTRENSHAPISVVDTGLAHKEKSKRWLSRSVEFSSNGQLDWNSLSVKDLADAFVCVDYENLSRIPVEDFLDRNWEADRRAKLATEPLIFSCVSRWVFVGDWVATEIVGHPNLRSRVHVLKKIVDFASELWIRGDFQSATAIVAALQSAAVSRLRQTWKGLSAVSAKRFEALAELCGPQRHFKFYRAEVAKRLDERAAGGAVCIIPFLGLTTQELTSLGESSADYLENGHINFEKALTAHKIISKHFQLVLGSAVTLPQVAPEVLSFALKLSQSLPEEALYEMSLRIEPLRGHR